MYIHNCILIIIIYPVFSFHDKYIKCVSTDTGSIRRDTSIIIKNLNKNQMLNKKTVTIF
jgi:hypothetical protein